MTFKSGQSGNPEGRPKGSKSEITKLREAVKRIEAEKSLKLKKEWRLYDHFIRQAVKDNGVLIALCKKLIPDLKQIDGSIERKQLNLLSISLNPEFQELIQSFLGQMARMELTKGTPKSLPEPQKEAKEGKAASSEPSGSTKGK